MSITEVAARSRRSTPVSSLLAEETRSPLEHLASAISDGAAARQRDRQITHIHQLAVDVLAREWLGRGWGPALHVAAYSDQGGAVVLILKADPETVRRTPASWFGVAAAQIEQVTGLRSRRVAVGDDRGLFCLSFVPSSVRKTGDRRVVRYEKGRTMASEEVVA